MANHLAIAAVSSTIRRILEPPLKRFDPTAEVKLYGAPDFQVKETKLVVSLYLFRVAANTNRRNLAPRRTPDGRRFRPALPVDLFYLVSAWGSSVEMQHQLLGTALRALEDSHTLSWSLLTDGGHGLYDTVFRPEEAVELIYDPLPFAEMINLWDLLKPGIQPSATYVARQVELESEIELPTGEPVIEREFDYVKPIPYPLPVGSS